MKVNDRMSWGERNTSNSLSRVCFISTPMIESIPNSANVEWKLTVLMFLIPVILS